MMSITKETIIKYISVSGLALLIVVIFLPIYKADQEYWGSIFEGIVEMRSVDFSAFIISSTMYFLGLVFLLVSILKEKRKILTRFVGSALCTIPLTFEIITFMRKQQALIDIYTESPIELAYGAYLYFFAIILLWASLVLSKIFSKSIMKYE